ncbi:MAG: glyoxylate/hydroxypyruvate reductase A [Desulfobacterales bacterium]|nr:glyoxylate/hydroxypyruvate reductase A [Desulfobacterales bacterium]
MALLIVMPDLKTETWVRRLKGCDPTLDLRVWPETGNPDDIEFTFTWNHPPGEFLNYPNLKCIASMGAGVDHILRDPDLPRGVPITRVKDPSMARSMSEYVIMAILNHCRQSAHYARSQAAGQWRPRIPLLAAQHSVGILGLGQLGADLAGKLTVLGFPVAGWRRSAQPLAGIETFWGESQQGAFLARSHILVCLLPLTETTRGILNAGLFAQLPQGAFLINVARGAHLKETDLLAALNSGQLSGACLDVFDNEPLPVDHPFWGHEKIVVTPHISSLTHPRAVVPQICENYRRAVAGLPLNHVVDRDRGY